MASAKPDALREQLLREIREGYDHAAWHGTNLKGTIRRVKADQAGWRPRPQRKCIAEIVLHCAYWKYTVRRRIRGDKRGSFVLKGSNWFVVPRRLSTDTWKEYVALLDQEHAMLLEAVSSSPWSKLTKGGTPAAHIHGVAMHDVYHAGQIQTIKALFKDRK